MSDNAAWAGDGWHAAEPMAISRTNDGKIVTDHFPRIIALSDQLERHATGPHLRRARNYLVFRLDNGRARYSLIARRSTGSRLEPTGESLWRRETMRLDAGQG